MTIHKTVPIGYEFHQVEVPDFHPSTASACNFFFIKPANSYLFRSASLSSFTPRLTRKSSNSTSLSSRATTRRRYQTSSLKVTFFYGWTLCFHPGKKSESLLRSSLLFFFFPNIGSASRDRARTKAMNFLHQMGYNYIRAKFYILFPYYLTYNRFKCHQPLALTDSEMARRIGDHLEGLKSTKEK